ncbi:MAG TPA: nuclear transport factor 2 family protein [Rhizomicrobium sp.]|nr:nuclear transport factor 2 family protein [Rhizomicrobium sp.]
MPGISRLNGKCPRLLEWRLILALSIPLLACSPQAEPEAAKSIESVLLRQEAAWNRGDIAAFMSGYWTNPGVRFLSGDKIVPGWNETLAHYRAKYATRAQMGTLGFSDLRVDMLAPDAALVVGRWRVERAGDRPHGVFSLIFRKISGRWVIVLDHTS